MIHAQRPLLVTAPAEMPVGLDEAKAHLRVDHAEDDVFITALIAAATSHLDGWAGTLGRCLVTQTWSRTWSGFPACDHLPLPFVDADDVTVAYRPPGAASDETLASSLWHHVRAADGDRLHLASGFAWPATAERPDAVTVTATHGFGAAAAVPQPIKAAILLMIGDLYRNRETGVVGTVSQPVSMSVTVEALLAPWRKGPQL